MDHGKTTLVKALTGTWTAKHSEELKRGITIKIGYADAGFWKCPKCEPPQCYTTKNVCPNCGSPTEFLRAVSFVDCPGHEILMTTMLSGAAVMDGAILVIAANEKVPQPQTKEHLAALEILGVKNIVIVQNKIDLVTREKALENYKQILSFIEGTIAEDAPIIPVSAQWEVNIDLVIKAIEEKIPTPKRDLSKPPLMYVLRSFDINRPGTSIDDLKGGVIGGSLLQGYFQIGDEIEIRPGVYVKKGNKAYYEPLYTEITSLQAGGKNVEKAYCGGLVGIGTKLDPSITKGDGLIGNIVGRPGHLRDPYTELTLDITLFERIIGLQEYQKVEKIKPNEAIVLNIGTATTLAIVRSVKDNIVEVLLRRPVCIAYKQRVAISRKVKGRWRLIGYGIVKD